MKIEFYENGPMIITESDLSQIIRDGVVTQLKDGPIALCRCGQTDTAPFCNGAHVGCDFKGAAVVLQDTRKVAEGKDGVKPA